ncbi:MAG: ABC transporter permease [Candidatus Woesearchaeota archaeon]
MIKDYIVMAFRRLINRRLRTFLTLIGIFIGIAAVVALVSLSQGFQKYLETEYETLGADKILIGPKGSSFGSASDSSAPLRIGDLDVVKRSAGVKEASYFSYRAAKIGWGKNYEIFAAITSYPLDSNKELIEQTISIDPIFGRTLKPDDNYRAVVGYYYYDNPDKNLNVGDTIKINGKDFKIVGINKKIGNEIDDQQIYISETAYNEIFNVKEEISSIIVRVDKGLAPSDVLLNIEKDLRKYRNVKEGQEDFEVTTFEDLIQAFLTVFSIVGLVFTGIAAISLIVGGIGIMNTMYMAVIERTQEIGVMKAIGAKNSDIFQIFIIESGMLGLIGGIMGVVIGLGIAKMVEYIAISYLGTKLLQAAMPAWLIIGALLFAFILGCAFGTLPARSVAKMNPVDSLRSE